MSWKTRQTFDLCLVIVVVLMLVQNTAGVKAKVLHKPKIAKNQHPTCKASDMLHSDIVSNGLLHVRKLDNFTFLGRVRNMKECLGLCCSDKKCGLAYLVNNTKCFSTQCEDPELCRIKKDKKKKSKDIQISLMVRNEEKKKVYITAYVIMAMATFGAALSGTVWIAYVFVKKYRENKGDEQEQEKLSKEPQVY